MLRFLRGATHHTKAIWWEIDNMNGSTIQLAEVNGRLTYFILTANHGDYPEIM